MDRAQAIRLRRRNEKTVQYVKHAELCLFSNGTFVPKQACTCGSKQIEYMNILAVD